MLVDSITITNNSTKTIEIVSNQDDTVNESDRIKKFTIQSKETFVFFTDRVESLHWIKHV